MEFSDKLKRKAAKCQTPEELLALAKSEGLDMTPERAAELFAKFTPPAAS